MKFPFTYHSKSDQRLICLNLNEQYQIIAMEVWDELQERWLTIPPNNQAYSTYLTDFASATT